MKIKNKKILERRKEILIDEVKDTNGEVWHKLYYNLSEILNISRELNKDYTMRELAQDVEMHEQSIYKILLFRKANDKTKQLVKDKKISFYKIVVLFNRYGKGIEIDEEQNKAIGKIIDNNMSRTEIDKLFTKENKKFLTDEKIYTNRWNIYRDVESSSLRLSRALLAYKKMPANKKEPTKEILKRLNKKIEIIIKEWD